MSSTKNVFGIPGIWVPVAVLVISGAVPFFGWEYPFDGERAEKKEPIVNGEETKNHRPASPPSVGKVKIAESNPKEEPKPVEQSPLALESMSDQDWQAMALESANPSERRIVEQHFKRENAFKASLNPTQKKAFDAEVKIECAKLLASSVVEGELSDLLKKSLRRGAESVVIADWRGRASRDRKNAELNAHIARREENLRILQEEFLLGLDKEMEAEGE